MSILGEESRIKNKKNKKSEARSFLVMVGTVFILGFVMMAGMKAAEMLMPRSPIVIEEREPTVVIHKWDDTDVNWDEEVE